MSIHPRQNTSNRPKKWFLPTLAQWTSEFTGVSCRNVHDSKAAALMKRPPQHADSWGELGPWAPSTTCRQLIDQNPSPSYYCCLCKSVRGLVCLLTLSLGISRRESFYLEKQLHNRVSALLVSTALLEFFFLKWSRNMWSRHRSVWYSHMPWNHGVMVFTNVCVFYIYIYIRVCIHTYICVVYV